MTGILDTIDHAIADHELSADAMRWTPGYLDDDQADNMPTGHTYAEYTAAAERLAELMRTSPWVVSFSPINRRLIERATEADKAYSTGRMLGLTRDESTEVIDAWLACYRTCLASIDWRLVRLAMIRRAEGKSWHPSPSFPPDALTWLRQQVARADRLSRMRRAYRARRR